MTLYHCPDCDRIHDEPFEAPSGVLARCIDCVLTGELARSRPSAGSEERRAA
jgi:hypothetical protein